MNENLVREVYYCPSQNKFAEKHLQIYIYYCVHCGQHWFCQLFDDENNLTFQAKYNFMKIFCKIKMDLP